MITLQYAVGHENMTSRCKVYIQTEVKIRSTVGIKWSELRTREEPNIVM